MVLSYTEFFVIYASSLVLATLIGLLVLVGWKDLWLKKILRAARFNAIYLVILTALPLLIEFQGFLGGGPSGSGGAANEVRNTSWVFDLGGDIVKIVQSWLNYGIVTDFLIIIYAWFFYFLLYFAPVLLLARDDRLTLRKYAIAFIITYCILMLFYALFPVSVSSSFPETGVVPILYVNTYWGRMITSVDPLNNDFPSGHVSLIVTAFLVFATAGTTYRRFSYFLGAATVATVVAVLALGIHWTADVIAGFLVGIFAVVVARNRRIHTTVDRWVRAVSEKIFGPFVEEPMGKLP
jgi:membrane-associated phospholipid phosphatase